MKQLFAWVSLCLLPAAGRAQAAPKASPYDSAHYSWRKPVPRNRLRELQSDRPGVTETPFTVDAGHVQLEMDALRLTNRGAEAEARERYWQLGYSVVKLGLSRRTAVQVELPLYNVQKEQPRDEPDAAERRAGFGDVSLRVKHNFLGDAQDGSFALAAIGYVRLPTGGQVGSGAPEYGLIVPVDIELSDHSNLEAQLATGLDYDREQARRRLRLAPSVALEYDFTEKLGLITETVAQWDTQQRRWQTAFNLAPILKLTENLQLDAGISLALNRRTDQQYFAGFTLRR